MTSVYFDFLSEEMEEELLFNKTGKTMRGLGKNISAKF